MLLNISQPFSAIITLWLYDCGLYTTISTNPLFAKDDYISDYLCVQYMFFERTSVTLTVIIHSESNAYCIINHRLHTSWQCWRGTKSTVASQPRSIADRCWWLLNQLSLPPGSCRRVCVLAGIYMGILNVCSSVFVMRLQDTPSILTLFGKSPLPIQAGSVFPPLAVTFTARRKVISIFFRMESFGLRRPLGCCRVYYFGMVMHNPCGK